MSLPDPSSLTPVDIVVLILSTAVAVSMVATILGAYITRTPITDERAKNIAMVTGAIVAIISAYVSGQAGGP